MHKILYCKETAALGGGKFVTASGKAWYVYVCKAMVARA
jgi:hypothetical protein